MSPKRILVTEDDPSIRCLLATILRRASYDVDTAANGRDAVEKAQQTFYDVIVLDLMMPVMSGAEVLASLTSRTPNPRFVVILSAAPLEDLAMANGANVFATLQKPSGIHDVLSAVDACIAAE